MNVTVKCKIEVKARDISCLWKVTLYNSISNTASETLGSAGDEGAVDGPRPQSYVGKCCDLDSSFFLSFLLLFLFLAPLIYSVKSMLAPYPQAEQPTVQTF